MNSVHLHDDSRQLTETQHGLHYPVVMSDLKTLEDRVTVVTSNISREPNTV